MKVKRRKRILKLVMCLVLMVTIVAGEVNATVPGVEGEISTLIPQTEKKVSTIAPEEEEKVSSTAPEEEEKVSSTAPEEIEENLGSIVSEAEKEVISATSESEIEENSGKIPISGINNMEPMMIEPMAEPEGVDQTTNPHVIRTATIEYQLKGETGFQPLPEKIEDSRKVDKFRANYSFEIDDNIDSGTGAPNRTVKAGDYYLIQLPKELDISGGTLGGTLGGTIEYDGEKIADYTFIKDGTTGSYLRQN